MVTLDILKNLSSRYEQLTANFTKFVELVEAEVNKPSFLIKGIATSLHLDSNYFTASFIGRTVRYVFSAPLGDSGTLKGMVRCYLMPVFPATEAMELSSFTFTGNGQTNINDSTNNDPLNMTSDLDAIYLALTAIYEGLSK